MKKYLFKLLIILPYFTNNKTGDFMKKTDLLCEEFAKEVNLEKKTKMGTSTLSEIILDEENAKKYNRKPGVYFTIYSDAILNVEKQKYDDLYKAVAQTILKFICMYNIKKDDPVFVVGLGNQNVTPDSLGPKVIDLLLVTRHLHVLNKEEDYMQNVLALAPGVMSQTGVETVDIVSSVVKKIKPKLVIVIDALASKSMERVNQTIQMTNTGIAPGSGIGNKRKEFSKETLGCPCVAIGVPTVVDVRSVVEELQHKYMDEIKFDPFAIMDEKVQFMVTPKEIDQNIIDLAHIISDGLNLALHNIE